MALLIACLSYFLLSLYSTKAQAKPHMSFLFLFDQIYNLSLSILYKLSPDHVDRVSQGNDINHLIVQNIPEIR